jgi:hypothetical protein
MFQKAEKQSAVEQIVRDAEAVIANYIGHSTAEAVNAIDQHSSADTRASEPVAETNSWIGYAKSGVSAFRWSVKAVKETVSAVVYNEKLTADRNEKANECFLELKTIEDSGEKLTRIQKLLIDNMILSHHAGEGLNSGELHKGLLSALKISQPLAENLLTARLKADAGQTDEDKKAEVLETDGPTI